MKEMAKIKENIDNSIDDKLKRFDVIMDYSLVDKIKFRYIRIIRALTSITNLF